MVVHKLRRESKDGQYGFSACGKALHLIGGTATKSWNAVTCKHCLKHQKKQGERIMKSAFEGLKENIIESIRFSKNLTDLKERLETILQEYDLEEE